MADRRDAGEPGPFPEDPGEGRWLTYTEIAQIRGIGRDSAVKLAQREEWRRIRGNDGTARVLVPTDWLKPARPNKEEASPEAPPEPSAELGQAIEAFEAALGLAREQLERASASAEQADQRERAERARADALQERTGELLAQLATAEADAKAAHDRAWASGEQLAAAERRAAVERERADRAESRAANERQDFMDAESRTRREMGALRDRLDATEVQLTARQEVVDAAEEIRQANDRRLALGRWARLRAAWHGQ